MTFLSDVRYAVRSLRGTPLFTLAALVSLTLGIATATTVFSFVDAAMLRPPPFTEAGRLAVLNITQRTPAEGELRLRWSWPRFRLLQERVESFEAVASNSNAVVTITGVEDPEPLPIELVSAAYLGMMGAPLVSGSGFPSDADRAPAAAPVVVLGWDLWQRRFGGSADVVGRTLALNGVPLTVVGVAGRGFHGVSGLAHAWVPATMAPALTYPDYLTTNQNFITVMGRLRRGVTLDAAASELLVLGPRIHAEEPSEADSPMDEFGAAPMTLNEARIDHVTRRALLLLAGAVVILLLIACANVASLLLGRSVRRKREIAVRLAIGAGRRGLVRQLLVESGVLAAAAGALSIVLTYGATSTLRIPRTLARGRNFYGAVGEFATPEMDGRVLAFAIAVCALTVLLFGLLPALRSTRTDLMADLRAGRTEERSGSRPFSLRETIVALQLALSVVLVVGCALLLTSYARLRDASLGFDPTGLLTFEVRPSEARYPPSEAAALIDRVLEEIGRVPGVRSASVDGCTPLSTRCANGSLHRVERPWPPGSEPPEVLRHYVAPAHFETLGVPVLRGRALDDGDRAGRPHVVVINQAAAARFWPDEDPIGRRVWFDGAGAFGSPDSAATIVGIVGNVAFQPLDENPIQPSFFTPYAQFTYASRLVIVRAEREPLALVADVARAVRRADRDLALFDVQTMEARARTSWSKLSFQTGLFVVIGLVALSLAVTGVYAVTSFLVSSRIRDVGVRMALGASGVQVVRDSLRRTVRVGLAGGGVGLLGAVGLSRTLRASLYETSTLDPRVFLAATAVLIAAFVAASYLPVRRATRLDPSTILRAE